MCEQVHHNNTIINWCVARVFIVRGCRERLNCLGSASVWAFGPSEVCCRWATHRDRSRKHLSSTNRSKCCYRWRRRWSRTSTCSPGGAWWSLASTCLAPSRWSPLLGSRPRARLVVSRGAWRSTCSSLALGSPHPWWGYAPLHAAQQFVSLAWRSPCSLNRCSRGIWGALFTFRLRRRRGLLCLCLRDYRLSHPRTERDPMALESDLSLQTILFSKLSS